MPMVSESQSDPNRSYTVTRGSGFYPWSARNGRQRTQLGYRSGPLSEEELRGISAKTFHSSDTVSMIGLLDDMEDFSPEAVRHGSRAWPVNDRDYAEWRFKPVGSTLSYKSQNTVSPYTVYNRAVQGALSVTGISSGYLPAMPSEGTLQNKAAQMLRNSRPPEVGFDLARFAGEQREAGLLFKASNYMPRTKGELAGAYINYLFGLKPTGSDLGMLAELVLRSDGAIRSLLDAEKIREKKYSTFVISNTSGGGETVLTTTDTTPTGANIAVGSSQLRYVYITWNGTSGNPGNTLWPVLRWSYTQKQLLRTFATWEYFIPQPRDIRNRLDSYRAKAESILSAAKLTESAVYELTPWSWLANWFVDFGGLLRYQRAVVDNQLVATACGYSTWEEYTGFVHLTDYQLSPAAQANSTLAYDVKHTPVQTSIQWRRHKRRGGNPYSIGPTWSLDLQQWAILGALGLARGTGQAIKK